MNGGRKGFTLIDLVIVLAIIAIPVSFLISFFNYCNKQDSKDNPSIYGSIMVQGYEIRTICIDGFEYYFSNSRMLIPKFDPKDRLPKLCDAEKKP